MKMVKLREVARFARRTVSPHDLEPETPYLGLEHIESGGLILEASTVEEAGLRSSKFAFTSDHVLFGKLRPNLAKVARPEFNGVCSTDMIPIAPGPELDRGYLAHYLLRPETVRLATARATGVNLPRLSPAALGEFEVPLLALEEQRRIADILDKVDALRAKRQKVLDNLDALTQSIFHDMFGTVETGRVTLGDCADIVSGITKGRRTVQSTRSVPYMAVVNVQAGHLNLEPIKYIEATEAEISKYRLIEGDLLLTEGGDPDKLGRGVIWRQELPEAIHQNHVFRVRLDRDKFLPDFMEAYVRSLAARHYFLRSAKQTTGIASINMTQLRKLPVPEVAMDVQHEYWSRINRARAVAGAASRSLALGHQLAASLTSRAFTGDA